MIRHSFFWKLFVGNIFLMAAVLFVAGVVSYRHLNANYQRENRENQHRMVRMSRLHFQRLVPLNVEDIDGECKRLFENSPMRMTVIAGDGRVLGDSQANPLTMENHKTASRPEILRALRGKAGCDTRSSETLGVEFRYFAEPIEKDGEVVGVVRTAMPVRTIARGRIVIRDALLWSALAAVIVAVAVAILLSWIWHAPLRKITLAAGEIAAGDLSKKVHVRGSDELAQLAGALNDMRRSLAAQIGTITSQRKHLSAVVQNLREGVIAMDDSGRIILMNLSGAEMFSVNASEATGLNIQSVVRIPDVLDAIRSDKVRIQTNCGNRTLDLHVVRIPESGQDEISVLLVFRDITEIARTAAMKTEFVANASHELRTPLATIRAAVDSIVEVKQDDRETIDEIIPVLDRNVTRLENMINSLLDLHVTEAPSRRLNAEKIGLSSLAEWVKEHFARSCDKKNIDLKIAADPPGFTFESDLTLVRTIIQNLVENAIKFTPAGGKIECLLDAKNDLVCIKVSDTGCGIPEDLQQKVFERFFQADPSRTGDPNVRGMGLGLAIVKHAAERLGGKVSLQSQPAKGTTLIITIPTKAYPSADTV